MAYIKHDFEKIGERIKNERKIMGISSLDEMSEKIENNYGYKISRQALSDIEKGNSTKAFTVDLIDIFCEMFDCDAAYLLCEYDECKTYDDQFIHKITGLSEIAILELRQLHAETIIFREANYNLDVINTLIEQLNNKNNSVLHWITIYLCSKGLEKDLWYYTESGTILSQKIHSTEPVIHMEESSDTFDNLILIGLQNRIKALKEYLLKTRIKKQ